MSHRQAAPRPQLGGGRRGQPKCDVSVDLVVDRDRPVRRVVGISPFSRTCSAPPKSSHELGLMVAELSGAEVLQGLVRPMSVVPVDPAGHGLTGLGEVGEVVLPYAFLLETAEEALDQAALLGCVRGDELLLKPVVSAGGTETATLKDEDGVAAKPMTSRSWQSITAARCAHPSRPQGMWVTSIAQRRSLIWQWL